MKKKRKVKLTLSAVLLAAALTCPAHATETSPAETIMEETIADTSDRMDSNGQQIKTTIGMPGETGVDVETTGNDDTGVQTNTFSTEFEDDDGEALSENVSEKSKDALEQNPIAAEDPTGTTDSTELTETAETDTTEEDRITLVEKGTGLDEEGNVTLSIYTAENIILPVTVEMRGTNEIVEFTVREQGQQLKMKPGSYILTHVVDGNSQKLADGANLEITDEGGYVYLDFTVPEETGFQMSEFILSNLLFIPFLFLLYTGFHWFKNRYIS